MNYFFKVSIVPIGVQRLSDARGQRGSWVPSKIFCISLAKFLTTFFSRSPKFFTFFVSVVKFNENSLLGCPPVLHCAPVTTFFASFLIIHLHFKKKTGPLDAPQGGCLGPSHRPHPLCTPLIVSLAVCYVTALFLASAVRSSVC